MCTLKLSPKNHCKLGIRECSGSNLRSGSGNKYEAQRDDPNDQMTERAPEERDTIEKHRLYAGSKRKVRKRAHKMQIAAPAARESPVAWGLMPPTVRRWEWTPGATAHLLHVGHAPDGPAAAGREGVLDDVEVDADGPVVLRWGGGEHAGLRGGWGAFNAEQWKALVGSVLRALGGSGAPMEAKAVAARKKPEDEMNTCLSLKPGRRAEECPT